MAEPIVRIDTSEDCTCPNKHPHLDEFIGKDIKMFHFEQMGNAQFWMALDFTDGTRWDINCGAVNENAKGYSFAECITERVEPADARGKQLAAVRELIEQARKVSPSASMSVYVVDIERALGLTDAETPRKVGNGE